MTTAARHSATRAAAVPGDPSSTASARGAATGATSTSARIDEEFLGRSRGNLADYAMRSGQLHQGAARRLRSIASISARDPRCISALGPEGAQTGLQLATSSQILVEFRVAVAGISAVPAAMRARFDIAKKLAMSTTASMKQVAIISDAMAQNLYAFGDPQGALRFAAISGRAVNRVVSAGARIAAQLDKVELR